MKKNFRGKIRKGGEGGTPQIRNSFFAGKKIRKGGGGGTPLTDKIRKVVFGGLPYLVPISKLWVPYQFGYLDLTLIGPIGSLFQEFGPYF